MSKTFEMIQKTLNEIEKTSVKMDSKPKTAEEIKDILLNISGSNEVKAETIAIPEIKVEEVINNEFCFDMNSLRKHKEDCNRQFIVPYFRGIMPSWKHFNRPVIFIKKVIRKLCRSLIEPMVEQQNNFNASATNALNALYNNEVVTEAFISQQLAINNQVIALLKQQETMKNEIERLASDLSLLVKKVDEANEEILEIKRKNNIQKNEWTDSFERQELQVDSLGESIAEIEKTLDLFTEMTNEFLKKDDVKSLVPTEIANDSMANYSDIDYFDFEANFRGSQYSVKEKLKDYVKFFPKTGTVVELGCGRGEFLELLDQNNVDAVGVDTYSNFVEYCTKKGLRVFNKNAVEYMDSLEEQSIAGVFAAQVIEHLSTNELVELCNKSYEKLIPGGVLIFETPNPTNLSMYLNGYYMDPTHHNPVHPKTLEYLLKKAGFKEIDIIYTEQSKIDYRLPVLNASGVENLKEFNDGINLLSDVFFGSQDYAVIARK